MRELSDSHGRHFHYLRLSVTDVCNFRCVYCLPHGYQKIPGQAEPLTVVEIGNLVAGFAELGFWKVRLTGGEPTIRQDIVEIARAVAQTPGIRKVAVSTNGYRLRELAKPFKAAGVNALNVSIDSLDRNRFQKITGQDRLPEILSGVDAAFAAGISEIKVNTVLMKDANEEDFELFLEWVREKPVSVRFIELMETGHGKEFFQRRHLSAGVLRLRLLQEGWKLRPREEGDGPAVEFVHPDFKGRVGLIAPYSEDFCASCNRLRVTSRGGLRLCLFGEKDYALRPLLQDESQREELVAAVVNVIERKEVSHFLQEGKYGNTWNLSRVGG